MRKKIVSLLLIAAMSCTMIPTTVFAQEDHIHNSECEYVGAASSTPYTLEAGTEEEKEAVLATGMQPLETLDATTPEDTSVISTKEELAQEDHIHNSECEYVGDASSAPYTFEAGVEEEKRAVLATEMQSLETLYATTPEGASVISTKEELLAVLNAPTDSGVYTLGNDITVSASELSSVDTTFSGTLDGGVGYTIHVEVDNADGANSLFRQINGGTLQNLNIVFHGNVLDHAVAEGIHEAAVINVSVTVQGTVVARTVQDSKVSASGFAKTITDSLFSEVTFTAERIQAEATDVMAQATGMASSVMDSQFDHITISIQHVIEAKSNFGSRAQGFAETLDGEVDFSDIAVMVGDGCEGDGIFATVKSETEVQTEGSNSVIASGFVNRIGNRENMEKIKRIMQFNRIQINIKGSIRTDVEAYGNHLRRAVATGFGGEDLYRYRIHAENIDVSVSDDITAVNSNNDGNNSYVNAHANGFANWSVTEKNLDEQYDTSTDGKADTKLQNINIHIGGNITAMNKAQGGAYATGLVGCATTESLNPDTTQYVDTVSISVGNILSDATSSESTATGLALILPWDLKNAEITVTDKIKAMGSQSQSWAAGVSRHALGRMENIAVRAKFIQSENVQGSANTFGLAEIVHPTVSDNSGKADVNGIAITVTEDFSATADNAFVMGLSRSIFPFENIRIHTKNMRAVATAIDYGFAQVCGVAESVNLYTEIPIKNVKVQVDEDILAQGKGWANATGFSLILTATDCSDIDITVNNIIARSEKGYAEAIGFARNIHSTGEGFQNISVTINQEIKATAKESSFTTGLTQFNFGKIKNFTVFTKNITSEGRVAKTFGFAEMSHGEIEYGSVIVLNDMKAEGIDGATLVGFVGDANVMSSDMDAIRNSSVSIYGSVIVEGAQVESAAGFAGNTNQEISKSTVYIQKDMNVNAGAAENPNIRIGTFASRVADSGKVTDCVAYIGGKKTLTTNGPVTDSGIIDGDFVGSLNGSINSSTLIAPAVINGPDIDDTVYSSYVAVNEGTVKNATFVKAEGQKRTVYDIEGTTKNTWLLTDAIRNEVTLKKNLKQLLIPSTTELKDFPWFDLATDVIVSLDIYGAGKNDSTTTDNYHTISTKNNMSQVALTEEGKYAIDILQIVPEPPCIITATVTEGGTISPNGEVSISPGENQRFDIVVNNGYKIRDVLIDGVSVGAVSSYTFNNVTVNHTLKVIFEKIGGGGGSSYDYYTITATAERGGTISPNAIISVREGTDKEFKITPDRGYKIQDVLLDGKSIGARYNYTFKNIDKNHTIHVKFEENQIPQPGLELDKGNHFAYMVGYPNNTFDPEQKMTRAEAIVMFSRLLANRMDANNQYPCSFSDISGDEWYANVIGYMTELGIAKGYPDGTFGGNKTITRAEFAALASRFETLGLDKPNPFTDVATTHWAKDYIASASGKGWIIGYPDGTFKPENYITRAEVVSLVNRMLERYCDEDYVERNLSSVKSYADIDRKHWAYYPICEASNGHDYIKENDKESWKKIHS